MTRKFYYDCPACEHRFIIDFYPGDPGVFTGPPERCYPPEAPDFDPARCPKCNVELNYDLVCEAAAEDYEARKDAAAEAKAEALKERDDFFYGGVD